MGSILSIDYGKKRIGLAISDPSRNFAFPYDVIENKNFNHVLSYINNVIAEKEIDLIIIGMPYNMSYKVALDGEHKDSEMEALVKVFVTKLNETLKISIETVDERLSSFIAEERLKERGVSIKKSKKFVDQEAARLLLEEYIREIKD